MTSRVVTKNLAGEEDLLLGSGTAEQDRGGVAYTISKVGLSKEVSSLAEMEALDITKFRRAVVLNATGGAEYFYDATSASWKQLSLPIAASIVALPTVADHTDEVYYVDGLGLYKSDGTDWVRQYGEGVTPTVATLAELQALDATSFTAGISRYVNGRTSAGDGYSGTFVLMAGDFTTEKSKDPTGGVVVSALGKTDSTFIWVRQITGQILASWWGAKGAKTYAATPDDTAPIQAGCNFCISIGATLKFTSLYYRAIDTIDLIDTVNGGFGMEGRNGNVTRFVFDNATPLKNMFNVGEDMNYITVRKLYFIDNLPFTSRCFQFTDTRSSGASPSWKHLFEESRVLQFKEGVVFNGAATFDQDAHCSEVLFLHCKFKNNHTSLIYNNTQAVNHQYIATDFENDHPDDATGKWTHILLTRGSTINHSGGSVIGYGPYIRYKFPNNGNDFQKTSQFISSGVRMEARGDGPFIDHDTSSVITLSAFMRVSIIGMAISYTFHTAPVLARFGGRSVATFKDVQSNAPCTVDAYMTTNLAGSGQYGSIELENVTDIKYRRISAVTAYGSAGVASTNYRAIPCETTTKSNNVLSITDVEGYRSVENEATTIYAGGVQTTSPKTLVYKDTDNAGFFSGSNPGVYKVKLPLNARPYKFRILRDDVNAASPFVMTLRAVLSAPTTITGAADNGSGLIRITTAAAHGLLTGDGATITGVTGTTESNGDWTVTAIGATTFDLQGSVFANAYISGGSYTIDKTLSTITPTSGDGGHFEADLRTATGLVYYINDGVVWDGKMKIIKSGTVNGMAGLIMIDYM